MSFAIEEQFTDIQESIRHGLPCDFSNYLKLPLRITKHVWHLSKLNLHESRRVLIISTPLLMLVHISHWQANWLLKEMTFLLSKAKLGIWCDYCRPTNRKQAAWTVHSELPKSHGRKRSYCNDCAIDVSKWADGSYFSLDQQIEYAKTNGNTTQGVLNGF